MVPTPPCIVVDISSSSEDEAEDDEVVLIEQPYINLSSHKRNPACGDNDVVLISKLPCPEDRTMEKSTSAHRPMPDMKKTGHDDCCILDGDPEKRNLALSYQPSDVDDLVVVGESGPIACRDYPHARHQCAKFPFKLTSHESHCEQCHCYVCDVLAPCLFWSQGNNSDHCHAFDKDDNWKRMRSLMKSSSLKSATMTMMHQMPRNQPRDHPTPVRAPLLRRHVRSVPRTQVHTQSSIHNQRQQLGGPVQSHPRTIQPHGGMLTSSAGLSSPPSNVYPSPNPWFGITYQSTQTNNTPSLCGQFRPYVPSTINVAGDRVSTPIRIRLAQASSSPRPPADTGLGWTRTSNQLLSNVSTGSRGWGLRTSNRLLSNVPTENNAVHTSETEALLLNGASSTFADCSQSTEAGHPEGYIRETSIETNACNAQDMHGNTLQQNQTMEGVLLRPCEIQYNFSGNPTIETTVLPGRGADLPSVTPYSSICNDLMALRDCLYDGISKQREQPVVSGTTNAGSMNCTNAATSSPDGGVREGASRMQSVAATLPQVSQCGAVAQVTPPVSMSQAVHAEGWDSIMEPRAQTYQSTSNVQTDPVSFDVNIPGTRASESSNQDFLDFLNEAFASTNPEDYSGTELDRFCLTDFNNIPFES